MKYMSGNEQRGKSYAIRLLIHYLGDIHQPLHSLARVDSDYPSGDRGGNDFPVPSHYSTKELHAVWDSVMYEFHVNDKVPYTDATWAALGSTVTKLRNRFSISPNEYNFFSPDQWAEESYKAGSNSAYDGAVEGEVLSAEYVKKNNEIAARQLVLASHRLVMVIQKIFGTRGVPTFLQ